MKRFEDGPQMSLLAVKTQSNFACLKLTIQDSNSVSSGPRTVLNRRVVRIGDKTLIAEADSDDEERQRSKQGTIQHKNTGVAEPP